VFSIRILKPWFLIYKGEFVDAVRIQLVANASVLALKIAMFFMLPPWFTTDVAKPLVSSILLYFKINT